MKIKYFDMVFNETLRKYPIVDSQFRKGSKDFKTFNSNLIIPKDSSIMLSPDCSLYHDERFYEEPSKFDPERFTDENVKKRHPFCYHSVSFLEHFLEFVKKYLNIFLRFPLKCFKAKT